MKLRADYHSTLRATYTASITQAMAMSVPPLLFLTFQSTFGIPLDRITLLITLNFLIQLGMDYVSSFFVDRVGYRPCIVAGEALIGLGFLGLSILPDMTADPYTGLLIADVVYALGSGLVEVLMSPLVEACPTKHKDAHMSLLHSFYCWGCVLSIGLTTAFFAAFGVERWRLLFALWAILPLSNAVNYLLIPIWQLEGTGHAASPRQLLRSRLFWVFLLLMTCSGAAEQGMSQWASAFAESALGVSKTVGDLAGPCMFAILMGIARVLYARFHKRINLTGFMLASGALSILSYLLAALAPSPVLGLVGCAMSGFAAGILWPGTLALAGPTLKGGTAMYAYLSLGGDLGCCLGPTVVGLVADAAGGAMRTGLLLAIVFPALLLAVLLYLRFSKSVRRE